MLFWASTRLTRHAAQMDRELEPKIIRRAFAKQVLAACGIRNPRVEAAFAAVVREDFLGPGPWQIVRWGGGYRATPDPTRFYLYTDDVIGILPERNLNSGQPSLHAALIGEPHLPPAPCSSSASWSDIGFTSQ